MLDALLVILSGLAGFGVAAIELHAPAGRVPRREGAPSPHTRAETALASGLAALLGLLAWWAARATPGTEVALVAGVALLLYGLWRLTGAIVLSSGALTVAAHDQSAGEAVASAARENRPTAGAVRDPAGRGSFARLLARWLAVGLVAVASGVSVGQPAAALEAALAGLIAFGALVAGPLTSLLGRSPAGVPALLVGLLVATLGTLWAGADVGIAWPGGGVALLTLFVGYLIVATGAVEVSRQWDARGDRRSPTRSRPLRCAWIFRRAPTRSRAAEVRAHSGPGGDVSACSAATFLVLTAGCLISLTAAALLARAGAPALLSGLTLFVALSGAVAAALAIALYAER